MTLILFSQGPTKHSRIGNSLVWMSKVSYWLNLATLESFFPWGHENYSTYFSSGSSLVGYSDEAHSLYNSIFDESLSAVALSRQSRLIEHQYEKKNSLQPFTWDALQISDGQGELLYITGKLDIYSDEAISEIRRHKLVICHEPFNLVLNADSKFYGHDYSAIAPCQNLLRLNEQYIVDNSFGKPTAALHVRRGDYQNWRNGRYFYDDDFWLAKTSELIENGYQPWIFSNDLSKSFSERLKRSGALISNGSFEDDFVRLMFMDRVSGPPSTFSGMAVRISKNVLGRNPVLEFFEEIKISAGGI
jgi:hypothetical protein